LESALNKIIIVQDICKVLVKLQKYILQQDCIISLQKFKSSQ